MNKLLAGILIGGLGLYAYQRASRPAPVQDPAPVSGFSESSEARQPAALPAVETDNARFHCDGRTYCSQMTSCDEAMFFLQNCPGVKMDGEGDGIPCEKQWCGRH
jgi:hypothetical protein